MKGQRLFVRTTGTGDDETLREFYRSESFDAAGAFGLDGVVAKLVGELVAHLTWRIEQDRAVITHLYVAKALRRRRVGLALMRDAIEIARARGVKRVIVSGTCSARDFFLRTGFADLGQELVMEVP